jgi:hypothetical protein
MTQIRLIILFQLVSLIGSFSFAQSGQQACQNSTKIFYCALPKDWTESNVGQELRLKVIRNSDGAIIADSLVANFYGRFGSDLSKCEDKAMELNGQSR